MSTLHLYLQLWATLKQTPYGIFHDVDSPVLSEQGLIENLPSESIQKND